MRFSFKAPLPFYQLFPNEEPLQLSEYFKGFDKEFLKKSAAFFLGLHRHNSAWAKPKDFVLKFFSQGNAEFANSILKRLNEIPNLSDFEVPYELSSLRLFETAIDAEFEIVEGLTQEQQEINLFKAYLLLNQQLTTDHDIVATASTAHLDDAFKPAALLFALQFHNFDLTNFRTDKIFASQFLRAIMFFEFLSQRENCTPLLKHFYEAFGVKDYKDYIKRLLPISSSIAFRERETYTELEITHNHALAENVSFLEKLSIDDSEVTQDYDFRGLRSRPIYKTMDGTYIIISPLFALELLYNGLYFKLNDVNKALPANERVKNFIGLKTLDFSEKYLLNYILKSIFGHRYIQKTGEELDAAFDGAPDYYVRNGKRIFLFESKDVMVGADIKQSGDYNVIEPVIVDRLYKPKGIAQIINNIRKVLTMDLPFDSGYAVKNVIVFPVLVLHNRMYMAGGFNKLMNRWFQNELNVLSQEGLNVGGVRPLVIIDIDTLIFNKEYFEVRKLNFDDVLTEYQRDYINYTVNGKKFPNEDAAIQAVKDSYIPFSDFLDEKTEKFGKRIIPKELMGKGYSLFA